MAENHRSSTLVTRLNRSGVCWGWPRITAQVHSFLRHTTSTIAGDGRESPLKYTNGFLFPLPALAGDGRESPLKYTVTIGNTEYEAAGDGRESPLKYTVARRVVMAAHAGDGRESPLKYTRRASLV